MFSLRVPVDVPLQINSLLEEYFYQNHMNDIQTAATIVSTIIIITVMIIIMIMIMIIVTKQLTVIIVEPLLILFMTGALQNEEVYTVHDSDGQQVSIFNNSLLSIYIYISHFQCWQCSVVCESSVAFK
tara:strand:+ start:3133 stop:3516 length:384 start_codon:yes stop_codon:yes gene_type:complete